MNSKLNRLYTAYNQLISEIYNKAPVMVILTFLSAIVLGLFTPLSIFVKSHIFNDGIAIAEGRMTFGQYIPYLILLVVVSVLPDIISFVFIYGYVEPRSLLILRTSLKGRMLQKIKKLKYEHFENENSMEIINKAYNRAENSARHMFPMYVVNSVSSTISSIGTLLYLFSIKWWLVVTVLVPFIIETCLATKSNYNIYTEMESYYKKERQYGILSGFLKSREYLKENKLFQASGYLIDTYKSRLNERNREYENFYFRNLKRYFTGYYITKIAPVVNVILLLFLFINMQINIGLFISISLLMFGSVYGSLSRAVGAIRWSGFHINFFDYYNKYFNLSEDEQGENETLPRSYDIEFKDVWFRYPGTDKDILKGLSFKINNGDKVSIVGKNGEGKTTMIKLLLGLFTPDKGEILIDRKPLFDYTPKARSKIFGMVFQDFVRYSISAKENVAIGDIDFLDDQGKLEHAFKQAKADEFIKELPLKDDTLLGRDFDGGTDISGGQWQRIAIARAFMGDKSVLILDEPTSQLDPIAESELYNEFSQMAEDKTTIFITHRLASTMITDKIFVISDGKIAESGTHEELVLSGGLYSQMFESQKQWYQKSGVTACA